MSKEKYLVLNPTHNHIYHVPAFCCLISLSFLICSGPLFFMTLTFFWRVQAIYLLEFFQFWFVWYFLIIKSRLYLFVRNTTKIMYLQSIISGGTPSPFGLSLVMLSLVMWLQWCLAINKHFWGDTLSLCRYIVSDQTSTYPF